MALDSTCVGGIIDSVAASDPKAAKTLYFVNMAVKLYSNDCSRRALLALLGLNSALGPTEAAQQSSEGTITDKAFAAIMDSGIAQVGEQYVYRTTREATANAMEKVSQQSEVVNAVENIRNVTKAIMTIATVLMTANNEAILGLARITATKILENIEKKKTLVKDMRDDLRKLHNALLLLNYKDFKDIYLEDMRKARDYLEQSREKFVNVVARLKAQYGFQGRSYQAGINYLNKADEILTPKPGEGELANKIDNNGLIMNGVAGLVGLSVNAEQKAAAYAIPGMATNLLSYIDLYTQYTTKINAMLGNYINAFGNLKKASGGKLTEYQIRLLDGVIAEIDEVTASMDNDINNPDNLSPGYSLHSYEWFTKVKIIKVLLKTGQPEILQNIDQSNEALRLYQNSVVAIKSISEYTALGGKVVLLCPYGQEIFNDLILQLGNIVAHSYNVFLFNKSIANLTDLVVIVDARLRLVQVLLSDITSALEQFKNTESAAIKNLVGALDQLGFDRAKDLLVSGDYNKFFNINDRTATYVGAAMTCLRSASDCSKDKETKNQIDELLLILKRYEKNKSLEASRSINSGRKRQKQNILEQLLNCQMIADRAAAISKEKGCDPYVQGGENSSYSPTQQMVAPTGGFNTNNLQNYVEGPSNRLAIIDAETDDYNSILDPQPNDYFVAGMYDRNNEIPETERKIAEINRTMSVPPTGLEMDQLNLNQNLYDSLKNHDVKRLAALDKLKSQGFESGYDSVVIEAGIPMRAYKNGNIIYERDSAQPATVNLKVILTGNQ